MGVFTLFQHKGHSSTQRSYFNTMGHVSHKSFY